MTLSPTLSRYLAMNYLKHVMIVLGVVYSLIVAIDLADMSWRVNDENAGGFLLAVQMSALRLPAYGEKIVPFAILLGAMWTFVTLSRSSELVVTRTAGISAWQFLTPILATTLAIGFVLIAVWNPFSAALKEQFDALNNKYIEGQPGLLAVSAQGLWLRQADARAQTVIRANSSDQHGIDLKDITIFEFSPNGQFQRRIDAARAQLRGDTWLITDALVSEGQALSRPVDELRLPTPLTPQSIKDSFAKPDTLSFWELPGFIDEMERSGFAPIQHKLHYYATLGLPALMAAMVMIGAAFTTQITSRGGIVRMVLFAAIAGFGFYFANNVALSLGAQGSIPVELAGLGPPLAMVLLGLALLLQFEDG